MSHPSTYPAPAETARTAILEMLTVAAPVVTAMTSYTLMNFTDRFLGSRLGPDPVYVGAQGNGGLASWVPISIAHGGLTIINTYVAQNVGAGRPERGPAYAWNGIWVALLYWLFVLVPYGFALPWIFKVAGLEARQAELATEFGQILVFGSILTLCTRSLSQFFFGMQRGSVIMVAGVTANIFNLFASATLAYGNGPTPDFGGSWLGVIMQHFAAAAHATAAALHIAPQGVAGSAYGTVLATLLELGIPLLVFLGPKFNRLYATRAAWRWSVAHLRDIARLGWPGGLMFGNEMICWGYFMVHLVSRFGKEHATAGWIAHSYMSLSFMPAVGISFAATALVGKYQGAQRSDLAQKRAWLATGLAVTYTCLCGVCFVIFREPMINLFVPGDATEETRAQVVRLGSQFLIATAAFQFFDGMAMVMSGALRGAGDTVFPGVATVGLSWVVIVGGGEAMVHFAPGLESLGPWIAAASYIVLLCVFLLARFLTGRWKAIKVVKDRAPDLALEPMSAAAGTTDGIM